MAYLTVFCSCLLVGGLCPSHYDKEFELKEGTEKKKSNAQLKYLLQLPLLFKNNKILKTCFSVCEFSSCAHNYKKKKKRCSMECKNWTALGLGGTNDFQVTFTWIIYFSSKLRIAKSIFLHLCFTVYQFLQLSQIVLKTESQGGKPLEKIYVKLHSICLMGWW